MVFYTYYDSPVGSLLLAAGEEALTGLWLRYDPDIPAGWTFREDHPVFELARQWLDRYFRGETPDPALLPLSPAGTPFQLRVWQRLLEIPYGQTVTYGAIAKELSPTMSAQAVGGAVGRNPISIIIPCHRVVGAQGQLTGYAGGLENKVWLLRHEGGSL